ncbi:retron St85 family RNA-directed DNA polymerase [Methylorubrum extorquens]|uniref:retron St85 family RNA-directed DNA polymerase n=1 Tax=Methylorubrum extorquens TaxID=408 RepID=UPI00209D2420|nr:retron St85 family RNA-directed DNA polymerase [Methylorubrum extorquens]MCP1536895.1 retron-type reverse transcriptase [Methylorubrum extorquens]
MDLGDYLGISHGTIYKIIKLKNRHYRSYYIKKRDGRLRAISSPRTFLKVIQWWINDTILSEFNPQKSVYGFVKGKSYIQNAQKHQGAAYIYNIDLRDFFPSITKNKARAAFQQFGYSEEVSEQLAEITTLNNELPQGAPTSPMLANIAFDECDRHFGSFCAHHSITYSRYADDLTFSSDFPIRELVKQEINTIIVRFGFRVNENKIRYFTPNQRRYVTGLRLGKEHPGLDRKYLNSCRGWFHRILTNPNEHRSDLARLQGTVEHIKNVGGPGSQKILLIGEQAIISLSKNI